MSAARAAKKAVVATTTLGQRPRVSKLTIKNFRCIGPHPVVVELDDIVVLVGPNNVGKSSVLKAYELVMSEGASEGQLALEDFPDGKVDVAALPEIELETIVFDNSPGEEWMETRSSGDRVVREKWTWQGPGKKAERRGYLVPQERWATDADSEKVPWGAPGVANSRRPQPHRVDAFASPMKQAEEVVDLLVKALMERVKAFKSQEAGDGQSEFQKLLERLASVQTELVREAGSQIERVEQELTDLLSKVFPRHIVKFDAKPEGDLEKAINFFKAEKQLLVGPNEGYLSTLDRQGSGARRTLLWTAIKLLAESGEKGSHGSSRPHVLLLDEPELCLHPNAVRDACELLYGLPNATKNWQVMVTTHSPCFIDFSRDHTSVVRVEREASSGEVKGTTIYRPSVANFTGTDKELLKLLNFCDPYVAEFFFGGRTILVEGDTEYAALKFIAAAEPERYRNIHVVRARGKATLVALAKILNQFKTPYAVLHDSDRPTYQKNGEVRKNPAWAHNLSIRETVDLATVPTRVVASIPNFEAAYLDAETASEKPYHALVALKENGSAKERVRALLEGLTTFNQALPDGAVEWTTIEELLSRLGDQTVPAI